MRVLGSVELLFFVSLVVVVEGEQYIVTEFLFHIM
jgi:hypothetical protein